MTGRARGVDRFDHSIHSGHGTVDTSGAPVGDTVGRGGPHTSSTRPGRAPAHVAAGLEWGARFLPEIRQIVGTTLGPELFVESTRQQDVEEATDLSILQGRGLRIAVRVRRHRYLRQYGDEFTIRSLGRNGARTELDKILEGWGDFLFYGFATPDEAGLASWIIGDLNVFRWRCLSGTPIPSFREHGNGAGDTRFASFALRDFPDRFIRARGGHNIERREQ